MGRTRIRLRFESTDDAKYFAAEELIKAGVLEKLKPQFETFYKYTNILMDNISKPFNNKELISSIQQCIEDIIVNEISSVNESNDYVKLHTAGVGLYVYSRATEPNEHNQLAGLTNLLDEFEFKATLDKIAKDYIDKFFNDRSVEYDYKYINYLIIAVNLKFTVSRNSEQKED